MKISTKTWHANLLFCKVGSKINDQNYQVLNKINAHMYQE